MRVMMDLNK
jgi:hypothetical protein